jgi:glutathione peroxidase
VVAGACQDRLMMTSATPTHPFYDAPVSLLNGSPASLAEWRGKVVLVVNVASHCGYTPQYSGLEALHRQYAKRGFSVLGFPCNQFGDQESGTADEIQQFCSLTYDVTFPIFSKVDVNGSNAHPAWSYLKQEKPGLLGTEMIKWNFTKFLVGRDGGVLKRFGPGDEPASIESDIVRALS